MTGMRQLRQSPQTQSGHLLEVLSHDLPPSYAQNPGRAPTQLGRSWFNSAMLYMGIYKRSRINELQGTPP